MTSRAGKRRSASLRERLADRPLPSLEFPLLVDADKLPMAEQRLQDAQQQWRQVILRGEDATAAQAAVDQARAAVDDCYARIVLRALRPAAYEALIAEHPPTKEQRADGEIWNPDTFRPALLAVCVESDMTEQDWTDFLADHVSQGERQGLYVAALAVNEQTRVAEPLVLPKGSTPIRS